MWYNFYNIYKCFNVVTFVICDSTLKFIHCYTKQPGSVHDMRVFRLMSGIQSMFTEDYFPDDSHLIGDAAYAVQKHMMVPFKNNCHLTEGEIYFNKRLCSVRVMVERAIDLLKGRFRSLLQVRQIIYEKDGSYTTIHHYLLCATQHLYFTRRFYKRYS